MPLPRRLCADRGGRDSKRGRRMARRWRSPVLTKEEDESPTKYSVSIAGAVSVAIQEATAAAAHAHNEIGVVLAAKGV